MDAVASRANSGRTGRTEPGSVSNATRRCPIGQCGNSRHELPRVHARPDAIDIRTGDGDAAGHYRRPAGMSYRTGTAGRAARRRELRGHAAALAANAIVATQV